MSYLPYNDLWNPRDPRDNEMGGTLLAGGSGFVSEPTEPASASASTTPPNAKLISNMGLVTAVMGGLTSAVGSYYAAKTAQYQTKSAALNLEFASDMAAINAHAAEHDAQSLLEAGKGQIARYTMKAGQEKAAVTAATAARGVVLGQGSARDVAASMDIVKDIDVLTINANAVRAAEAERRQATNYRNQALLYGVSGLNMRRSADTISPMGAGFTSLLGSASRIASQWNQDQMYRTYGRRN